MGEALKNLEKMNFVCTIENIANHLIPFLSREFNLIIDYARLRVSTTKFTPSNYQTERLKVRLKNELDFYNKAIRNIDSSVNL